MEHNNPTRIVFSKDGETHSDVIGIKQHAVDYARLLSEMGYPIHEVTDLYRNQTLNWRQKTDKEA